MSEHREEITQGCREGWESEDRWDQGVTFYDAEVWRSNRDGLKVEFLLAGGGPTIWVEVDVNRQQATFHHSWGMDAEGQDRHQWELYGSDEAFWVDVAETVGEVDQ